MLIALALEVNSTHNLYHLIGKSQVEVTENGTIGTIRGIRIWHIPNAAIGRLSYVCIYSLYECSATHLTFLGCMPM
jgi:hypothetical protein